MSQPTTSDQCVDCGPSQPKLEPPAKSSVEPSSSQPASQPAPTTSTEQPATFSPPPAESLSPRILIEFCDRCRWAPRATWIQTELFLTFPTPIIRSITLLPLTSPETGGRFRVWVYHADQVQMVWDRKTEGGFPELKVLKQRIRNILQPELSLGHSDKPSQAVKTGPNSETAPSPANPAPNPTVVPTQPPGDPASYREFETLIKRVGSHQGQGTEEERFKLWSLRL